LEDRPAGSDVRAAGTSRAAWLALNLVGDALFINLAVIAAFALRFGWPPPSFNFAAYQATFLPLTAGQIFIFFVVDLYDPTAERSGPELLSTVVKGAFLGILLLITTTFLLREFAFPRTVIMIAFVLQILLLWGWRRLAAGVLRVRWPERRILLVGSPRDALMAADRLRGVERWGYRLVAVVCDRCVPEQWDRPDVEWVEGLGRIPEVVARQRPDQVIMASPSQHREALEEVTLSPDFEGEIFVVPQLYEIHLGELSLSLLNDLPLLRLTRPARPAWQQGLKLLAERLSAALFLVILLPLFALLALAVLVGSGRPAIYGQERLGKDGRPFKLYKFRTMVVDAELEGPMLAESDDPRVTAIGRFLRLSRLDEIPQLYNVARGEMSFVGPRPERPEFVRDFIAEDPLYEERFKVRPGITGLAQVSGSYATTTPLKLRFDLMYVHHQSLSLDVRILLRTVKVVLTGRGAR
jgi:exopolysaccharide biosynthesis polyprenyl glycosylphosphotransferase